MVTTTIPLRPGEKRAAVKWRYLKAGESQPDRPDTQGRAILTGERSGGLVVIDVDVRDEGFKYFERLETHLGALPPTRTVRTPSGGLHVYLRSPLAFRSVTRVHVPGLTKIKGEDGVDIRAEGGIAVLPDPEGGRGYKIEDDFPIAEMPPAWSIALPKSGRTSAEPIAPEIVSVDASSLRQALADTAKGKRGEGWDAMRRAAKGERMISIEGGPPDTAPLVHGVDDFLSKYVIFALASAEHEGFAWYRASPMEVAALFEPSLSILRSDVYGLGGESKFTAEHWAAKWEAAAAKVAGQVAEVAALSFDLDLARAEAASATEAGCPLIVQIERKFFVLDDRARLTYEGPHDAAVLREIARKLWPDRPLEIEGEKGMRPMVPTEIMTAYRGEACGRVSLDYTASRPRVDDLVLVRSLANPPIEPKEDPEVQAWLDCFAGTQRDMLQRWIVWAAPERCAAVVPALAMINGTHVGKSLLAESIAFAAGQLKASPLKQVLGRQFQGLLEQGPIVFGDEGLPSVNGKPATEEFRDLVTSSAHLIELKGLDRRLEIAGAVRVLLAANSPDRLFLNPGTMGSHDVSALLRRLCVISIEGARVEESKARSMALGAFENDPVRRLRVAQHLRWIQITNPDLPQPEPDAGAIRGALRRGSDMAAAALAAMEDASDTGSPWLAIESSRRAWCNLEGLARALSDKWSTKALHRALSSYLGETKRLRVHPVTGEAQDGARVRWTEIDLTALASDGIELVTPSK